LNGFCAEKSSDDFHREQVAARQAGSTARFWQRFPSNDAVEVVLGWLRGGHCCESGGFWQRTPARSLATSTALAEEGARKILKADLGGGKPARALSAEFGSVRHAELDSRCDSFCI
jgi:hypothetical protein